MLQGITQNLPWTEKNGEKPWFKTEVFFELDELTGWLRNYVTDEPAKALDLLAEMLPLAVAKLKEKKR